MRTERLQLTLIPELQRDAQSLPVEVHAKVVEVIGMMLVHLVREDSESQDAAGVCDESR